MATAALLLLRRAAPLQPSARLLAPVRMHTTAPAARSYEFVAPTASGAAADLPFFVGRTGPGNLPVYSKVTRANTRVVTEVRLISGELDTLADALAEVTGARAVVRPTGSAVVVTGNHVEQVRSWLAQQGF
jgi:hypothetical protein